jgi:hypothetical protein
LLDAAEQATAEAGVYRGWAEDLAQALVARVALRNGLKVIPDESGFQVVAGYGTGLAGVLDFLLRLCHGGKRAWMVELP